MNNDTKIKYIRVLDKLYRVSSIAFFNMSLEAIETDMTFSDVQEDEVWSIEDLKHCKIRLVNKSGYAEIIDFSDWKGKRCC